MNELSSNSEQLGYTPTTEEVRNRFIFHASGIRHPEFEEQFDRWLAEHDRKVMAEAWHEGWRHEVEYLNMVGQFCPNESCNPYSEEKE